MNTILTPNNPFLTTAFDEIVITLLNSESELGDFVLSKRKRFINLMMLHYADMKQRTPASLKKLGSAYRRLIKDYAREAAPQPINENIYISLVAQLIHVKVKSLFSWEYMQNIFPVFNGGDSGTKGK